MSGAGFVLGFLAVVVILLGINALIWLNVLVASLL